MQKYFCDKCGNEMKRGTENQTVEGYIHFGKERRKICIEIDADNSKHFCKDCQIDAIIALDYRPKIKDPIEEDDDIFNEDGVPYVPPPLKKPRIPSGLHKTGGIVE
jgi:hypothetical protein